MTQEVMQKMTNQPNFISHTQGNGCHIVAIEQPVVLHDHETDRALQREIAERKRLEEALSVQRDLALALSSTSDLSTSLSYVLDMTLQLDGIDCGGIYLVDRHNGSLSMIVYRGLSAQFAKQIDYYDADTYQAHIVGTGKPLYLHASTMVQEVSILQELEGLRAIAILPICYEGQTLAALNLGSRTYDELSASTRTILESIAAQVGGGIARIEVEEAYRKTHDELEMRVQERTAKLIEMNKTLQAEINERKRSDQALIESEERYRTLVETSPSAILLTSMDRSIQFCNQQAVALFGYTSVDELCGKHGTDLVVLDNLIHDPLTHVQQILGAGNLRNIEYMMRRSDGSRFPAQVSSSIVTDTNNRPTAMIIIMQDISDRKLAEKALATAYDDQTLLNEHLTYSRNLLRAIFDGLDDGLMLLDHTGTIQAINRAFATLLGSSVEALVGTTWQQEHSLTTTLTTCLANHNIRQRIRYQYPDEAIRIFDMQAIALDAPEQTTEQIIVHMTDVTETVQLQARVLENERFAASGRLAASVAHEINTPLQGLQTALRMANVSAEKDRTYFLEHARAEIQRVGRIVKQLLDLYRPGIATYGVIHISTLIERILLLIGKRVREQKVVIEQDITEVPPTWGRADELTQVLLNVIVNALDVMPDGGTLRITCSHRKANAHTIMPSCHHAIMPQTLCIAIADTGPGISADIQEHIFEPFYTTKENGTGLGLAISKQILQQHGGAITVESQPNLGCTFSIELPVKCHETNSTPC